MSQEENDFVCNRTLISDYQTNYKKYEGCKECCLHCSKKTSCKIACALVKSELKDCPEAISKKGYMAGELFEVK